MLLPLLSLLAQRYYPVSVCLAVVIMNVHLCRQFRQVCFACAAVVAGSCGWLESCACAQA